MESVKDWADKRVAIIGVVSIVHNAHDGHIIPNVLG
jgi:hypothetical protein